MKLLTAKKPLKSTQYAQKRRLKKSNNSSIVLRQDQASEAEIVADTRMKISLSSLALISTGYLLYLPLIIIGIVPLIYLVLLRIRFAYRALIKEKHLSIDVIDSIWIMGGLFYGYYFGIAFGSSIYFLSEKMLAKTEDSSRKSLRNVFGEHPRFVWILIDKREIEIPFEQLKVDQIVVINTGEMIPVDGIIQEGIASIDQHRLTGESQPAEKAISDFVLASTLVLSGKIHIRVEKTGSETVAAQIGKIINETSHFKLSIQTKGQQMTDQAALPTLILSSIALPLIGFNGSLALMGNYPGANLRLLAPMTLLNFLKTTYEKGILVKDGRSLEQMSKIDTIVFDKTGTLTLDQLFVKHIHCCTALSETELLSYAATAEYRQTHPVAQAILKAAKERDLFLQYVEQAHYEIGYGIKVQVANQLIRVGSNRFMKMENITVPEYIQQIQQISQKSGHSLIMVAIDDTLVGAIELEASLRPETYQVIKQLQTQGLDLYIISGDQEEPTRQLAQQLGIEHYFANTLPENKAKLIEQWQKNGKTICFVGDGINDSIALTQADVSISLAGASSIAVDTAQIVLMDASLQHLVDLVWITRTLEEKMKNNVKISIVPGIVGISSVFLFHFGFTSSVMFYTMGLLTGVANTMRPVRLPSQNSKEIVG